MKLINNKTELNVNVYSVKMWFFYNVKLEPCAIFRFNCFKSLHQHTYNTWWNCLVKFIWEQVAQQSSDLWQLRHFIRFSFFPRFVLFPAYLFRFPPLGWPARNCVGLFFCLPLSSLQLSFFAQGWAIWSVPPKPTPHNFKLRNTINSRHQYFKDFCISD